MDTSYYSKQILDLVRRDKGTVDQKLVDEATLSYVKGDFNRIDEILVQVNPDYQLLEQLISKLRGKSVYAGLKKLTEGKDMTVEQAIISTSSLLTHVVLELKENRDYRRLVPNLIRKLQLLEEKLQ